MLISAAAESFWNSSRAFLKRVYAVLSGIDSASATSTMLICSSAANRKTSRFLESSLREKLHHELGRFAILRSLVRSRIRRRGFVVERLVAAFALERAPLVCRYVAHDSVQPRTKRRFTAKRRQTAVHGDEDLLRGVVERRRGHTQAPQAPPHEWKVLRVEGIEVLVPPGVEPAVLSVDGDASFPSHGPCSRECPAQRLSIGQKSTLRAASARAVTALGR